MESHADEIIANYEAAGQHFKKAVLMFALTVAATVAAIFFFWK